MRTRHLVPVLATALISGGLLASSARAAEPTVVLAPGVLGYGVLTVPVVATDASRLVVVVAVTGGGPDDAFELTAPFSAFSVPAAVGREGAATATPYDSAGNAGAASTLHFVGTAPPALRFADPTSTTSTTTGFPVTVAATGNPADTRYSVDQRVQGVTAWTRISTLGTGPSVQAAGTPGQTYAFRGQALDRYGNATVIGTSDRAVVPFDQEHATYEGRTVQVPRSGAYGGTVRFLDPGATATLRSAGDRLQVIGEACPTCGTFDVYVDGKRTTRVSSHATTTTRRTVLWSSPRLFSNRVRTVVVRAVTATVVVDALAARRFAPPAAGTALRSGQQLVAPHELSVGSYAADINGGPLVVRVIILDPNGNDIPTEWLFSTPRGGVRLAVQTDGNVVLYAADGSPALQTRTAGNGPVTLILQRDGNLVLYRDNDGRALWASRGGRTYRA